MNRMALLLWCAASATAESNFAPPVVGVVRDTHRQLRPVYGVAGNFVLHGAIPKEAVNWAFAGAGGLMRQTLSCSRSTQAAGLHRVIRRRRETRC